tara:strand:+ start:237 stop:728 length:492 start_codon:yes stop_codon:yes gene_type:complete
MDIKEFSSYSVYTNHSGKERKKYKNKIKINDSESSFLLQKDNDKLNNYIYEKFKKKRANKIDMNEVIGESTNKSNWVINDNNNGYITNLEENYDKYSDNFNLLLNNGYNIINDKDKINYFKKQFQDNEITCKKNLNNTTVNKYSEFNNKYKNDPFSIQSYYKL